MKESRELESKITSLCVQAFIGRKQQSRDIYFRLLGYNAVFTPYGKDTYQELESLRLKHMQEVWKTFSATLGTVKETYLGGSSGHLMSYVLKITETTSSLQTHLALFSAYSHLKNRV